MLGLRRSLAHGRALARERLAHAAKRAGMASTEGSLAAEGAEEDAEGYSMAVRAGNVFVTVADCTPVHDLLARQRWRMNASASGLFGQLLAATTCASHMTGEWQGGWAASARVGRRG